MASQRKTDYLSPEEYLELERFAPTKSEYWAGEMFAMAGASTNHIRITADATIALGIRLSPRGCEVLGSDLRVRTAPAGPYFYPDITVTCEVPEFFGDDNLLNPLAVIEVLSPSTANFDRGEKFFHYRRIASLREYILIAQDEPFIEHYSRQENGLWVLEELQGREAILVLPSLDCVIPFAEIYRRIP